MKKIILKFISFAIFTLLSWGQRSDGLADIMLGTIQCRT